MATSRYATTIDPTGTATKQDSTTTNSGGTTTTSPTTVDTTTSGTSTKDINSTTNTTNMDAKSLATLQALIQQLMNGGTPQQQQDRQVKLQEEAKLQQDRSGYSKDAAFADAQGLMSQQMRLALEKLMPSINSASLGAGASSSSMRALLTQRAAENAAENASAAGLGAAVNYGQISNGMSSVLANLIGQQDPVANALINALSVAKGATSKSTTNGTETTNSTGQQSQTSSGGTSTTSPTTVTQSFAPMSSGSQMTLPTSNFVSYGPLATDQSIALDNLKSTGSTADTLSQLWGANQFVNNYTF